MAEEFENKDDMSGGEDIPPTPSEKMPEEPLPVDDLGSSGSGFAGDVSEDDKLWALLAYIFTPLVPIIILLMEDKKKRPFLKAHNGQALAWGVLSVILGVTISPFLCGLPSLAMLVAAIYWGIQAYQGNEVTIPFITDFVKNQGWA